VGMIRRQGADDARVADRRDATGWSRRVPARIRRLGVTLVVALTAVTFLGLVPSVTATPVRGNTGWSVLLCKFSDVSAEPRAAQFFREMFTLAGAGLEGTHDYFSDQSYGRMSLRGSVVRDWRSMSFTKAQETSKSRGQKIQDCVDTHAAAGYSVPAGHRVVAIINAAVDSGAAGGRVLLDPLAWNIAFAAHEMGHGYGLGHSFSNDPDYQNADWSQYGEYDDPWDEMSAMNVYGWNTTRFGNGGVGFSAFHRDEKGWISSDRIRTFGADGIASRTITIAPLEAPANAGPLLVRVPFDSGDLFHYYTVEYRRATGWSRGIPGDTVLIHEVKGGDPHLIRNLARPGRPPAQSLHTGAVSIHVDSISPTGASVSIYSNITTRCIAGYVWREARLSDRVCVTPATRQQTRADNQAAPSRWTNGAYGPHTCIQGYVWREAFPGDDVCVTPTVRNQVKADNAAAPSRRNPARLVYGPNTCKSGYVFREADRADWVCVSASVRNQTRADNAAASSRWTNGPYGPHTCIQGYVWREAFPGDDVCVATSVRAQAQADNAAAAGRVLRPNG
jgi:hypothetical protein